MMIWRKAEWCSLSSRSSCAKSSSSPKASSAWTATKPTLPALAELKRRIRQCAALRGRGPCFRRARQTGTRLRRGVRLHRRHRLPCRHVRQGGSIRRRLHRMPEGDTGIPRQPHAHTYLHHRTAPRKHRLDTVCRAPAGRHAGTGASIWHTSAGRFAKPCRHKDTPAPAPATSSR